MKVSVIIPVFNVAGFIGDCLRSVMRQSYPGLTECLLVDDCGTDDSMAIAERMIDAYEGPVQFRIIHHAHNRGLSAARNTGLDAAQGDYILFLDSDDELTEDSLARLTAPLEKQRYDLVLGFVNYQEVLSTGEIRHASGPQELNIAEDLLLKPPMILRSYRKKWAAVAWNRLVKRDFLIKHHLCFREGLIYEDNLWSFQVACQAASLYMVSCPTYVHKVRKGSIMQTGNPKRFTDNWATILQGMSDYATENRIDSPDVFRVINASFRNVIDHYASSRSEFVAIYRRLRPQVKVSLRSIVQAHGFRIPDLHYLLPSCLAPHYLMLLHLVLRNSLKDS